MEDHTEAAAFPSEALRTPQKGDPLTLTTLRAHLRRCDGCAPAAPCETGKTLIRVFESGRAHYQDMR